MRLLVLACLVATVIAQCPPICNGGGGGGGSPVAMKIKTGDVVVDAIQASCLPNDVPSIFSGEVATLVYSSDGSGMYELNHMLANFVLSKTLTTTDYYTISLLSSTGTLLYSYSDLVQNVVSNEDGSTLPWTPSAYGQTLGSFTALLPDPIAVGSVVNIKFSISSKAVFFAGGTPDLYCNQWLKVTVE